MIRNRSSEQPTLAEYLAEQELTGLIQKKPFGRPKVPLHQLPQLGLWIFGLGAVFGRARCDKLDVVAKMFVGLDAISITILAPLGLPKQMVSNYQGVLEILHKVSSDGIRYYRNYNQKEPEFLLDLFLTSFAPPELDFRDIQKAKSLMKKKIRLGMALLQLDSWLFVGISLGAIFPELTEKIWRQSYETVDNESWSQALRAGVNIPKEFTPLPLEEMEHDVLIDVASYVSKYFPDLVEPLNLRLYC